jgi:L-alanine-DL-glutamate epimerase-like enolase superfamily enzyme
MKVTDLRVSVLGVPLDPPVRSSRFDIPTTYLIVTEIATDEGVDGVGYGAVLRPMYARPLALLIQNFAEYVVGLDPTRPEAAAAVLGGVAFKAGPAGMGTWAASAIEVALWDVFGKVAELPLYRLLGGARDRLPAYCIRGLTNRTEAELLDELTEVVEAGWRHVKIQIPGIMGDGHPDTVAAGMHRVRAHVGNDVQLALDNQNLWTVPQAIRLGRQLEDLDLFWFEEPVEYRDTAGLAQVAAALDTPVCSGEQRYGVMEFRSLIEDKGADVVMVDVRMSGGITPFRKIAAVCEMWNLPITNHMMTAIDIHVMGGLRNTEVLEYVPWTDAIFEEPIEIRDGFVVLPERPGLGCTLQPGVKERFAA